MDYFGVVREAWDVTRRERGLWGLGAFEALHYFLLSLLSLVTSVPIVLIAVVSIPAQQRLAMSSLVDTVTFWLASHYVSLVVVIGVVFLAYATAAVLSVAAQGGVVEQTVVAQRGRRASATQGLSTGFRLWWRSASILALPALPPLLFYLVLAVVMRSMLVAPIAAGQRPDFVKLEAVAGMISPLSTVVGLIGIPLGVLATVALRFAIIEDVPWRDAFREAWRFAKTHFSHVALLYLVLMLVTTLATFAVEFLLVTLSALVLVAALVVGGGSGSGAGVAIGAVGAVAVLVLFCAFMGVIALITSASWTVLYGKLRSSVALAAPGATDLGEAS